MKRKKKPSTGEISKYEARMNVDGSKRVKGTHYEETYAPVVAWATLRFFLSNHKQLAYKATRLSPCLHPGRYREGSIHEATSRFCYTRKNTN